MIMNRNQLSITNKKIDKNRIITYQISIIPS